jgi:hypothetical protein
MEQNISEGEIYELRKSPLTERVASFRNIIQQATNATATAAAIAGVTMAEATTNETEFTNRFEWATLEEHANMVDNQETKNIAMYLIIALMTTIMVATIVRRAIRTTTTDKGRPEHKTTTIMMTTTALVTLLTLATPNTWTPHIATTMILTTSAGYMITTPNQAASTNKAKKPEAHEGKTTRPRLITFMSCMMPTEATLSTTIQQHGASALTSEMHPVTYLSLAATILALTILMVQLQQRQREARDIYALRLR